MGACFLYGQGSNNKRAQLVEIYKNDNPSAYSGNSNEKTSPPLTVSSDTLYDYYEIEAVYSKTVTNRGKVILSKDQLSSDDTGNRSGVVVGTLQGTKALSVVRPVWLDGNNLNFGSSYSNDTCLITKVNGIINLNLVNEG